MADAMILGGMLVCAMVPFAAMVVLMRKGKNGAALTIISVIGAAFLILFFGIRTPIGLTPVQAVSWTLLFALPALLGASAGGLLGMLLKRREERRSTPK